MSQTIGTLRAADEGPRTFTSATAICLSRYVQFSGRAPRSEYWYFVLFTVIISVIANIIDVIVFGIGYSILSPIANLALLLPGLAAWVRRLHDTDRSGWWWLLALVPVVGWIILLVWNCSRGTRGPNRYGPDPLGAPTSSRAAAVA